MWDDWLAVAMVIAALGSGMMSGLYFIFSNTVMDALARLPPAQGCAAMQSINAAILNPSFFVLFFGTPAICIAILAGALADIRWPGAALAVAGAALHVAGNLLVTVTCNVPLNNRLAAADATTTGGAEVWRVYLVRWTRWNHLRAASCIGAAALLLMGLVERGCG